MTRPTDKPQATGLPPLRKLSKAPLPWALLASALLLGATPTFGDTSAWPGLRGPQFDGSVRGVSLVEGDQAALEVAWQVDLGSGYSSLVVGDGRVIALFAAGEDDVMAAFDTESGRELWRYRVAETYVGHDGSHDGPIATPALEGDTVVGFGPRGQLFALRAADGGEIWNVDVIEAHGAKKPHYGFTSSPVIEDGVVVVALGGGEDNAFAGFDLADGNLLWKLGGDQIHYQSPVIAELGGRRQALVSGVTTLHGLDPKTGEVLWSYEHGGDERGMGGATIVPLEAGEGRIFLMNKIDSSAMLQVSRDGDAWKIEELWTNNAIKSSYVVPVARDGYLYGISGRILTAVDAATGERAWRSREPGDGFPTLVGDHLVIITKAGSLHVVEASPEAYREVASLDIFTDNAWSAVSYAGGHLYARSMGQLARIDITSGAERVAEKAEAPRPGWLRATDFGRFLDGLGQAEDKQAAAEAYLGGHDSFPIIESTGAVHFVYRSAEAEDVGIVGDMIGYRREDPMIHVPGTDLFYYSLRLENDATSAYGFIPSYAEEAEPDPLNPRPGQGLFGEVSWFAMPAFEGAAFDPAAEVTKGRLETVEWESAAREGQTRQAKVYLPAAYDAEPERRFPVIYVHDGQSALEEGGVAAALDHHAGTSVEPLIAVFLLPPEENPRGDTRDREAYGKMFAEELVTLVDEKYRTIEDRTARASAGTAGGGPPALIMAFTYPQVFAKAASQAGVFMDAQEIAVAVPDAGEHLVQIYQDWGTYHLRAPHEGWDMAQANRDLWQILREKGHRPTGGENAAGFGWASWTAGVDDWLEALFPAGG